MPKSPGSPAELLPLGEDVIASVRLALGVLASRGWLDTEASRARHVANRLLRHPPDPLPPSETLYVCHLTGDEVVSRPYNAYKPGVLNDYEYNAADGMVAIARPAEVRIPEMPLERRGRGLILFEPVMPARRGVMAQTQPPIVVLGLTIDDLSRLKIGSFRGNVKQMRDNRQMLDPRLLNDDIWYPEGDH